MTRKEFISQLGIGAAFVLTTSCLGSCKKETISVDMTLDLSDAAYAKLKNVDSYIVKDGVVVAKTKAGAYIAATVVCSHEDLKQITLKDDEWYCTAHAARFDQAGKGLNDKGKSGIQVFQTTLTGTSLRVFS
jgi:nitrite reductase/ring-hydroxylating ferredoxin subunit